MYDLGFMFFDMEKLLKKRIGQFGFRYYVESGQWDLDMEFLLCLGLEMYVPRAIYNSVMAGDIADSDADVLEFRLRLFR